MSGSDDLKNLLDRLKEEVGPVHAAPEPPNRPASRPAIPAPEPEAAPRRPERFLRAHRPEAQREAFQPPGGVNVVWSENKEAMLFGVLASLIAAFGGVLSGLDYLALIGAVVFLLFSFMMLLALFGYYLNFRRRAPESQQGLAERVEALSRRLDALSAQGLAGGASPERGRDLEHKVEELRVLVRTLSRAVEQQNK